jgi:hypothetical protein
MSAIAAKRMLGLSRRRAVKRQHVAGEIECLRTMLISCFSFTEIAIRDVKTVRNIVARLPRCPSVSTSGGNGNPRLATEIARDMADTAWRHRQALLSPIETKRIF